MAWSAGHEVPYKDQPHNDKKDARARAHAHTKHWWNIKTLRTAIYIIRAAYRTKYLPRSPVFFFENAWPQLFKRGIAPSTGWLNLLIRWMVMYPVDSALHPLNKSGQRPVSQKSRNFSGLFRVYRIPFISSQRRGSKPSNFAILLVFLTLKTCSKINFRETGSRRRVISHYFQEVDQEFFLPNLQRKTSFLECLKLIQPTDVLPKKFSITLG